MYRGESSVEEMVEQVFGVFSFGSENWSWTQKALEKMKGWETKAMSRIFRFKREKEETWTDYYTRTCKTSRKTWVKMGLPFLCEAITVSMWRAVGWVCDDRPNAVVDTLKQVFRWSSTKLRQSTQASGMKEDPNNHTRWKHKCDCHNRGCVWYKVATDWAGKEDWMS